ncbi:hypothetical protein KQI49_13795 [Virgibacillus sp. MSJ-26]|uniref:hypothetical protein n=1 Tax=Virgibacillus sp. MSJ-26 TaxID=2841522 RepID=UPI001C115EC9|nr:hypothetical protein [Virgibacillus sp. MSJ-26]MBU5467898.1 hypothetical protein [Virgibacillus sp. MSJ-26]
MAIKNRTTHLMVMFPVDMVEEIEAYKFNNRIKTTSEAIRTLIKIGLEETEKLEEE